MSKKKILMYNGGKEHYYGCNNPTILVKGKLYHVVDEVDICGAQTNYTLNGIEGAFNSIWFSEPTNYFAYAGTVPVEGEPMRNFITFDGITAKVIKHTSPVIYVEEVVSNLYKVYTENTLYIVKVSKETSLYVVKTIRES